METVTWHDLADDHGVLELHEALTAPGPALELHVAWWADECGTWLGAPEIAQA